jgi:transketolase
MPLLTSSEYPPFSLPPPLSREEIVRLKRIATEIRILVVKMVTFAQSGHVGGPLGLADIYTVLFDRYLWFHPEDPWDSRRDRFVLSNGHVCAVAYACFALYSVISREDLFTFRKLHSPLQGHPSPTKFPWIENHGGSLGQGLSFAVGLSLASRVKKTPYRVFVGMSDGECQEGMTWEAAMSAVHYRVGNLLAFVDRNDCQIDGYTRDIMNLEPFPEKWEAFGWAVRVADGHDYEEIDDSFRWALSIQDRPKVILFRTIMGKGVSFMENQYRWHGTPPTPEEGERAVSELEEFLKDLT